MNISLKDLESIAFHMADRYDGVEVLDRKYRLKIYESCFIGLFHIVIVFRNFPLNFYLFVIYISIKINI